jgi:hypothetical protein
MGKRDKTKPNPADQTDPRQALRELALLIQIRGQEFRAAVEASDLELAGQKLADLRSLAAPISFLLPAGRPF